MTDEQAANMLYQLAVIRDHLTTIENLICAVVCGIGFVGALLFGAMLLKAIREKEF